MCLGGREDTAIWKNIFHGENIFFWLYLSSLLFPAACRGQGKRRPREVGLGLDLPL
jgi:hypothetical protein